jgi:hypothetical protein
MYQSGISSTHALYNPLLKVELFSFQNTKPANKPNDIRSSATTKKSKILNFKNRTTDTPYINKD